MTAPHRVLVESERAFQGRIVQIAKLCGWLAYHTYDSRRSEPGFPDLVLARPSTGEIIYWEIKTERGRVSPEQEKWINALHRCGQEVRIIRPSDLAYVQQRLQRRAATRPTT